MTRATARKEIDLISPTRMRVMGVLFLVIAVAIWGLFGRIIPAGTTTTFVMVPSGSDTELANWRFPTLAALNILALVSAFLGGAQLARARGFGKRTNAILGVVAGLF